MIPKITVLTLAVDDLEKSLRFYRDGLGFATPGIVGTEFEHGAVAFFDLHAGLRLALWPRPSLAHDTGLPGGAANPVELSLGHNVSSREEVDAVMRLAAQAGAKIIKPAQPTFWGGYAGYFADPDGHLWEVVWNPEFADRDITTTRVINVPRERVWRAWTEPQHLAQWWGPNGFTNTFHEFDIKPGGRWRFVMHAPNGAEYANQCAFVEIAAPERLVFDHLEPVHRFRVTATFAEQGPRTKVTFQMRFDSAAECERVKGFVVEANEQNFDRLEAVLSKMS
jgi:uncharacterized protein YndB with AHSA1/START domain/catechol 2,3-dioxygenase-like lactoylglutathione lyase family enzyme